MVKAESKISGKSDVQHWLGNKRRSATMRSLGIPLHEVRNWNSHGNKQIPNELKNPDKDGKSRFFEGVGVRVMPKGEQEGSFDQIAINEVPDPTDPNGAAGTVGLLIDKATGDILLQSTQEGLAAKPGSPSAEYVTIRPTLQGSYTNIKENEIKFAEYADIKKFDKFVQVNPSRIRGSIRMGLVYVDKDDIELGDNANFAWFSREQVNQGLLDGAPYNGFLHAALNLYNASQHLGHDQPVTHPKPTPDTHDTHKGDEGHKAKSEVTHRAEKKKRSLLDIQQGTDAFDSLSLAHLRANPPKPLAMPKWLNPKNWFKKKGGGHGGH